MTSAVLALVFGWFGGTAVAQPLDEQLISQDEVFVAKDDEGPILRLEPAQPGALGKSWRSHPASRGELAVGTEVIRFIGPRAPSTRDEALAGPWELTRIVHRDGARFYAAGVRETDVSRLRAIDDDRHDAVAVGAADRHGLSREHWLIAPMSRESDTVLSAHVALAVGGGYLDVMTGELVKTKQAWRSHLLTPGEARVGLRVARIEEVPARGAPDSAVRALRASWTVGPIESLSGGRIKLHGRWSDAAELRVIH